MNNNQVIPMFFRNHTIIDSTIMNQKLNELIQYIELDVIKKIDPIVPTLYVEEGDGLNPGYIEIEELRPLCIHEKRIFLLRADMALATGLKNDPRAGTYLDNFGGCQTGTPFIKQNNTIPDEITDYVESHLFGHPTLACESNGYLPGIYGGWMRRLSEDTIEILLSTGRFKGIEVSDEERTCIETHVARRMMKSQQCSDIIFVDFYKLSLDAFLKNKTLDYTKGEQRRYTRTRLKPDYLLDSSKIIDNERRAKLIKIDLPRIAAPPSKSLSVTKVT